MIRQIYPAVVDLAQGAVCATEIFETAEGARLFLDLYPAGTYADISVHGPEGKRTLLSLDEERGFKAVHVDGLNQDLFTPDEARHAFAACLQADQAALGSAFGDALARDTKRLGNVKRDIEAACVEHRAQIETMAAILKSAKVGAIL